MERYARSSIMALLGMKDKWIEIIDELKEMGVEYTIQNTTPRVNLERTGWNKPFTMVC